MTITFSAKLGTGRAKCQACKRTILEGKLAVVARGYMSEGQAHLDCLISLGSMLAAMDIKPEAEVR